MSRGSDDVHAGLGLRHGGVRQQLQGGIVQDLVLFRRSEQQFPCGCIAAPSDCVAGLMTTLPLRLQLANERPAPRRALWRMRIGSVDDAAVSVRHVLAQADVAHQQQTRNLALDRAGSLLHDAVSAQAPVAISSFSSGRPKRMTLGIPSDFTSVHSFTASSIDRL